MNGNRAPLAYARGSAKRNSWLRGWLILFLPALLVSCANGQGLASVLADKKPAATPAAPADPLNRDTPRDAIYNFLEACHAGNYARAAKYLDLSKLARGTEAKDGLERARLLGLLLDRDPHFEVGQLSDDSEGMQDDTLPKDMDRLDTFQLNDRTIPLYMQQETVDGLKVWLVSADSVARIPELKALAEPSAIEKRMPAPLVRTTLLGTAMWVWMGLVLLALLLSVVSRLLSRITIAIAKPIAKRYTKALQVNRLQALAEPIRLLLAVVVFRACMEVIAPSALMRDYLMKLLVLLVALGAASLVMRIVDVISDQWMSRLDPRERAVSYSVLPLGVRFVKICIFILAVLITLQQWGYNTTTILAGVGVGGLAVALAAQRTIENLFGGISVITDRPVLVGDVCQFGGQTGTVEDIGLRSTRIRTPDRTLVTVPNSQFSTMTLENYSRRDRIWFHPTLPLRRDTTAEQIRDMMQAISEVLQNHSKVNATAVPVRFTKITPEAFHLEVSSYVLTSDGDEFLRVQSELLLAFVDKAAQLGISFAVPLRELKRTTTEFRPEEQALFEARVE
ncbi:MAG: mechanosensitive ion channel family protein [Acidobacteriaceae bacterium]|nr:mechanosensitive ion channel family protein [Acidobacteriaceae bacterium]